MISAPRSFTPSRAVIELSPHACWSPRLRSYASLGRMCQTLVDLHTRHWSLTPAMSRFVCRRSSGSLCPRILWSRALVSRVIVTACSVAVVLCRCYCCIVVVHVAVIVVIVIVFLSLLLFIVVAVVGSLLCRQKKLGKSATTTQW